MGFIHACSAPLSRMLSQVRFLRQSPWALSHVHCNSCKLLEFCAALKLFGGGGGVGVGITGSLQQLQSIGMLCFIIKLQAFTVVAIVLNHWNAVTDYWNGVTY